MFLHLLNEPQKTAFLVIAQRISMADGEDSMDEVTQLEDLKKRLNTTTPPDMSAVLGELDLSAFTDHQSQVIILLELLALVYTDGYLHEAESSLIGDIAATFGFDQEALNTMAEWAMKSIELTSRGEALMGRS